MSKYKQGDLLAKINSPADLRELKKNQLPKVSNQLRQYILDIVSENGGHLGASLGVVELTVALHYTFNNYIIRRNLMKPNDSIILIGGSLGLVLLVVFGIFSSDIELKYIGTSFT